MAVFYKIYQDTNEQSKTQGLWLAKARMTDNTDLKTIASIIEKNVSVKESDVYAVLIELVNVIQQELQNSHAVVIDRLGTFRAGLKISPAASAAAFKANTNVKSVHVNFCPERRYLSGTGKGKRSTAMLLAGVKVRELPKNDIDTTQHSDGDGD